MGALVLAASVLTLYFSFSAIFFANSLYYGSNGRNLGEAGEALLAILPEGLLEGYFLGEGPAGGAGLRDFGPYRITLIRPDGTVVADSRLEAEAGEDYAGRPEVRAALAGLPGKARRTSAALGIASLYAAFPVRNAGGDLAGVFRVSLPVESFGRRLSSAFLPFLGGGLLVILAVFAALYRFSRSLTRPLDRLALAADSLYEETGAAAEVEAEKYPEIREFSLLDRAFRGMAAELKNRLERARSEGRRLEAILGGMDEAVLALDGELRLRLINPRAQSLFKLKGELPVSLAEAGCPGEMEEAARTALGEQRALEQEIRLFIDGAVRYFRLFAAPLAAGGDRVIMVLGDLTRLHRLEQVRKDFAANVSHELRTPIQLIKGFAETLLETSAEGEQLRRGIEIIKKNALTMENLTTDLLTLVSLEDGAQDRPPLVMTGIAGVIDEALGAVEDAAAKKKIRLSVDCGADLAAPLHGGLMVQALINLLDNAVKYSPPGSKVRIEVSFSAADKNELVIAVRDQGIGIPAEHQGRVFERFYRVDKSRSREQGGTGLGLAIVRHIALIHRGTAEVESHAGEGSVFRIRIPSGQ